MINTIGNFVPTTIRISPPTLLKASDTQRVSSQATQEILLPTFSTAYSFGDRLSVSFLLSPSDFSETFGNISNSFFSDVLPQLASSTYSRSSLLTASRLNVIT